MTGRIHERLYERLRQLLHLALDVLAQVGERALNLLILGKHLRAKTDDGERYRSERTGRDDRAARKQLRTRRGGTEQRANTGEAAPRFVGAAADAVPERAAHERALGNEPAA